MPELPEAETIVRELGERLPGRRIRRVELVHTDLVDGDPAAFRAALADRRVRSVARRGKNLLLTFGESGVLVVNLGMSGRLLLRGPSVEGPEPTHPGVIFHLADGDRLVYHDTRRFGRLAVHSSASHRAWSRSLGPEPLSTRFTARRLGADLTRSRAPIRSWLLDQRKLAGVGNIYANEALHRARIHPARPARTLEQDEVRRLHRALRAVLREAIDARGTTFRDYRTATGEEGAFTLHLRVYDREGEPCVRCRTSVSRTVFGNRSAFFCPECQPERPPSPNGRSGGASSRPA